MLSIFGQSRSRNFTPRWKGAEACFRRRVRGSQYVCLDHSQASLTQSSSTARNRLSTLCVRLSFLIPPSNAHRTLISVPPPCLAPAARAARGPSDVGKLTSTRFMLGMIALTSRMILALAAASIFSSLSVKMVFSLGASSSAGASAAAAAAPAAGAAAAAGTAISVMFRRVWGQHCTSDLRASASAASASGVLALVRPLFLSALRFHFSTSMPLLGTDFGHSRGDHPQQPDHNPCSLRSVFPPVLWTYQTSSTHLESRNELRDLEKRELLNRVDNARDLGRDLGGGGSSLVTDDAGRGEHAGRARERSRRRGAEGAENNGPGSLRALAVVHPRSSVQVGGLLGGRRRASRSVDIRHLDALCALPGAEKHARPYRRWTCDSSIRSCCFRFRSSRDRRGRSSESVHVSLSRYRQSLPSPPPFEPEQIILTLILVSMGRG